MKKDFSSRPFDCQTVNGRMRGNKGCVPYNSSQIDPFAQGSEDYAK